MSFIDELLDDGANFGSSYAESYAVQVGESLVYRYTSLRHPYVLSKFSMRFDNRPLEDQIDAVVEMFHKAAGKMHVFRHKHQADFSSNNFVDDPTGTDQRCTLVDAGARTWQLVRWYAAPSATAPRRKVLLPVAGTLLTGVEAANGSLLNGVPGSTVGNTTGIVQLPADVVGAVTNITQALQAVVTVGSHAFTTGHSVLVSGVAGMTQINGRRANVVGIGTTTITLGLDTTGFTAYSSGGTVAANPASASGEYLRAGFEFDLPVQFETDLDGVDWSNFDILSSTVNLVEVRRIPT